MEKVKIKRLRCIAKQLVEWIKFYVGNDTRKVSKENKISRFQGGWPQVRNNDSTICGSGSLLESCNEWIRVINSFVVEKKITKINDIGCGDLNFMKETNLTKYNDYLGYDLIPRSEYETDALKISTISFDISQETPRGCELTICKDVLNHLSTEQALTALENIKKTTRYLMLTNYPNYGQNKIKNKFDGNWEWWNFNKPPFNLQDVNVKEYKYRVFDTKSEELSLAIYEFGD